MLGAGFASRFPAPQLLGEGSLQWPAGWAAPSCLPVLNFPQAEMLVPVTFTEPPEPPLLARYCTLSAKCKNLGTRSPSLQGAPGPLVESPVMAGAVCKHADPLRDALLEISI